MWLCTLRPFPEYKSQGCFLPAFSLQPRVNRCSRPRIGTILTGWPVLRQRGMFWTTSDLIETLCAPGSWYFEVEGTVLSQPVNRAASGANSSPKTSRMSLVRLGG